MLNDRSRGYLQNCCYSKQLSMALLHASHPQIRLVGVRTSYIYIFFLIFPGNLEFWTPLQIPSWGPPLGCTLLHLYTHTLILVGFRNCQTLYTLHFNEKQMF